MKSYCAGIGLYLFAVAQTILVLMTAMRFEFTLSQHLASRHFNGQLDVALYLIPLAPFFFIGRYLYNKWVAHGIVKQPFALLGFIIVVPFLDAALFHGIVMGTAGFPLGFGLGFSDATAFAIVNSVYAVLVTLLYFAATHLYSAATHTKSSQPAAGNGI